jgi:hypothetical protein
VRCPSPKFFKILAAPLASEEQAGGLGAFSGDGPDLGNARRLAPDKLLVLFVFHASKGGLVIVGG